MEKKCFNCKIDKLTTEFYKHKGMKDGFLNKCKECCKKESINYYDKKSVDLEWKLKEKNRAKEKYHRLNYSEINKKLKIEKPWLKSSKYVNIRRKLKNNGIILTDEQHLHHWSYKEDNLEDIIIISKNEHRLIHRYISLDKEHLFFISKYGEKLNTKQKHIEFIEKILFKTRKYG
jgi:hypothetical protein